jgi:two-component system, chemotaxis family, CheB/CheR fusion protein
VFPIVGMGASAGGLEAFTRLLDRLPTDTGMAFVLVQHLDPAHESALTEILARATLMPVCEVTDNLRIEPNHVYVIPPDATMTIGAGVLKLTARPKNRGVARAIDLFFESLAQELGERAIGVVLSGTANDGTQGLEAIKAEGGITFAQDDSAKCSSMPQSAIAAGCVDYVLSPENIAGELARIAWHPVLAPDGSSPGEADPQASSTSAGQADPLPSGGSGTPRTGARQVQAEERAAGSQMPEEANAFKRILLLLRQHSGVEFSLYKSTTVQRRITRRMVLSKRNTLAEYAALLKQDAKELDALYSDMLISVTSFFRTPEAFDVLKKLVFPRFIQARNHDEPFRVWVVGCSTGQEAYSIAMAFFEYVESVRRHPKLQVFATDLNEALLEKARAGLYAKTLTEDLSPERLRRFFVEEQGGYRVRKPLRESVVFARQNLISDPPFSRMDLVSCRNLLIYFEPRLQNKILPSFHYALKPGGCLFLGANEAIGQFGHLFEPLDAKQKIFAKKSAAVPSAQLPISQPRSLATQSRQSRQPPAPLARAQPLHEGLGHELIAQREADRVTLARFAPPGVLVNAALQILQFRGATGAYLEPPKGKASFDILKMARDGLVPPLRAALNRAHKENAPVRRENVRFDQNGHARRVTLEVIPLNNLRERCYLVLFQPPEEQSSADQIANLPAPKLRPKREEFRRAEAAEKELVETRDYLQSIQEQYEAAHEELQAANEETQSANEELQSLNEELETSKEELESSNEELTTVNEEISARNTELGRLNDDWNNLHVGVNTAIFLLARDLTLRRFTPKAERAFDLTGTDVGRPVSILRHKLAFPELDNFIGEAINAITPREQEVQDTAGNWYLLRVRPYLSGENKIDGAVLVLVDINGLKETERKTKEAHDFAEAIIEEVPPLLILEPDLRVRRANDAFYRTFSVTRYETEHHLVFELGNGHWNIPALRTMLEDILPRSGVINNYEVTHDFERIGLRTMILNARQIDHLQTIILSVTDVTLHKRAEAVALEAKEVLTRHAAELEKTVTERTASLRETVRELEAFSYSLVHDMRAPLRAMNSFAHVLQEDNGHQLDEKGLHYVQRISSAAERLDQLIQDVLDYTRVLRDQVSLTPVNLDELLRDLSVTYPQWTSGHAQLTIETQLPVVVGHKALLAQCFSNLVGNAMKFVAPGVSPRVRIRAEPGGNQVRISVQDNGIGIAPEQRERIFGMFQRINPASEYEGTGIGLAIVRRAVERMQGQAGFESEAGKGSTFWIELPRADSK